MKAGKFLFGLSLISVTVFMASCNRDKGGDTPEPDPVLVPQNVDDVSYTQGQMAPVNIDGNMTIRLFGISLDESDSTLVSIQSADFLSAVEATKQLFCYPERLTLQEDGSYSYDMRSCDGSSYGKAKLYPSTAGNVVAELSFDPQNLIQFVTQVSYLKQWPENGSSTYPLGYRRVRDNVEYVCIREASPGVYGIFACKSEVAYTDALPIIDGSALPETVTDDYSLYSFGLSRNAMDANEALWLLKQVNSSDDIKNCVSDYLDLTSEDYLMVAGTTTTKNVTGGFDYSASYLGLMNVGTMQVDTIATLGKVYSNMTGRDGCYLKYSLFVDGAPHGTGMYSQEDFFPQYGGTSYDNDIHWADAPQQR